MKIRCNDSGTEYTSPIVGDVKAQLEDCLNWLTNHLKNRHPKVLKDLGLAAQMTLAAGVLAHADPVGEDAGAELWEKVRNEHQVTVAKCIGLEIEDEEENGLEEDEEGEEELQEAYSLGFDDCQKQIAAFLQEKGYPELASEVTSMEVKQPEETKAEEEKEDNVTTE